MNPTSHPDVIELLASSLQPGAEVVRTRLGRDVTVGEGELGPASSLLRFDLSFGAAGRLTWFISNEDATGFSDLLIGGQGDRGAALTEMHLDALTAATSDMLEQVVNGIAAGLNVTIEAGDLDLGMDESLPEPDAGGERVVRAFQIEGFGAMPIVQHADAALVDFINQYKLVTYAQSEEAAGAPTAAEPAAAPAAQDNVVQMPQQAAAAAAEAAFPGAAARSQGDLEMLMNVPLPLTVELGETQRTIRQLVDFTVGSIIELGKLAGDPLDIKVNDRVIARGEVVVIDEEFGIRITEIKSPEDRLRGLG
jgi:flagellar motor switch protein FliN/FliY